jgi:hypothetical protein
MDRQLPAGLSDAQRSALCEFFAGHISAGQLTQRLGIDALPQTAGSPFEQRSGAQAQQHEVSAARAVRHATARGRPFGMTRSLRDLFSLAPRRT